MTLITLENLEDLAVGAALLGTGGGGDPYIGMLMARAAILEYGPVDLMDLFTLPASMQLVAAGMMGAPSIMIEKLPRCDEAAIALRAYEARANRQVDAIIPFEAGGLNSMIPIALAAQRRLPVIDGDGMGRAFPKLEMETFNVYGVEAAPLAMADEHGNSVILEAVNAATAERLARAMTVAMGGQSHIVTYGMDGATARRVAVPGTMTLSIGIGQTIRLSQQAHIDPIGALISFFEGTHYELARLLTSGKIVDLERREQGGWSVGIVTIEPFDPAQKRVTIQIQNENLVAEQDGRMLAVVPDLIAVLDADTAQPIPTERLRYGQRVNVLGVRVPPIMRTPEALAVFGPRAFGIDADYVPLQS
jgi:DUF917 family protein